MTAATSAATSAEQVVLTLSAADRTIAYDTAAALTELIEPSADAVSIFEDGEHWRIDGYYATNDLAETAAESLSTIFPDYPLEIAIAPVEQQNWVAISQAALPPVHAGRFTICGSHDRFRVPSGPNTLIVDAGEAFGTSHHATTYGCLLALDRLTRGRRKERITNALDLGTGSGVLALALARAAPHARILATDLDERSIEIAAENAAINNIVKRSGALKFMTADGLNDDAIQARAPFDLIIANILAGPLTAMAPAIAAALSPGSPLVLSGILVYQARAIEARFHALGLDTTHHERLNGWSTLTFVRRGRSRRITTA